jgi:hypothetical protein
MLLLVAAASLFAGAAFANDRVAHVVGAGGGITVRLPSGWHVVHRSVTHVVDPIPRLALATFPVRLRDHPCECGMPNLQYIPPHGAFILIWEIPGWRRSRLSQIPARPASFSRTEPGRTSGECGPAIGTTAPAGSTAFRIRDRVFQADVYLGRAAGVRVRRRIDGILDSLRA